MEAPNRLISLDGEVLLCPHCNGDTLRHGRVVIANRRAENDDGVVTAVSPAGVHSWEASSTDLPGRCNSLALSFQCENEACPRLVLLVMQHKGSTLLRWVNDPALVPSHDERPVASVIQLPRRGVR